DDDDESTTVHLGPLRGTLVPYRADDAVFVGEDRVLLLERLPGGSAVRVITLGDPPRDEQPRVALEGIHATRIGVVPAGDRWIALGTIGDSGLVTVTARFGDRTAVRTK